MKTYNQFLFETEDALRKISSAWERKHGMKLHAYKNRSGDIELHSLEVPKEKRNSGLGSRALKGLKSYAKRTNSRIVLTAQAEKGKKASLERFYKRHGFKRNSGRTRDFTTRHTHIHSPKT